jgi:SAM-dependent methyltransferase
MDLEDYNKQVDATKSEHLAVYKNSDDLYLEERVSSCRDFVLEFNNYIRPLKQTGIIMADLGCGDGRATFRIFEELTQNNINIKRIFAVDIYPSLTGTDVVNVIQSDLNSANFGQIAEKTVHIAYSMETLEHLVTPESFVRETNRILVDDGLFILTTPNLLAWYNRILVPCGSLPIHYEVTEENKKYGRLFARQGPIAGHIRVFSPRALKELLHNNGFEVLKIRGLTFLYGKLRWIDSLFSHWVPLCSAFSIVAKKNKNVVKSI